MKNLWIIAGSIFVTSAASAAGVRETPVGTLVVVEREFEINAEECLATYVNTGTRYGSCLVQVLPLSPLESVIGSAPSVSGSYTDANGKAFLLGVSAGKAGYAVSAHTIASVRASDAADLTAASITPALRHLISTLPNGSLKVFVQVVR